MGKKTGSLVTAIIPTYNRPDLLRGAVESVICQTYKNIELIVVDDHSPTPAESALSSISTSNLRSIQVIRHDKNKGANVARNTGIKNASGDFIAFLDDDDKWEPTKIERQVAAFQTADDSVGVTYTGQHFINEEGVTTSVHISKVGGDVTKRLLCGAQIAPFSSVMVRSDVIQRAGLPDERFPCWQDREWYVRLSQYCEFKPIPEPLAIRHVGKHEQIGDNYQQKRDEAYPLFLEKHRPLASKYGRVCKHKMEASLMRQLVKMLYGIRNIANLRSN
ncbi:glycosyltransferase family 2 protein [Halalkalicoccus salilacus]|uniref:glycosyltransferase family 2 protein n=1 Tax=Halalkalicoccus sp. GCM10025704 TaxID=3252662 RepID=UPI003606F6CF